MDNFEQTSLIHEQLGSLPVVNWFLERLRLTEILGRYVPTDDARLRLAPATVIALLGEHRGDTNRSTRSPSGPRPLSRHCSLGQTH